MCRRERCDAVRNGDTVKLPVVPPSGSVVDAYRAALDAVERLGSPDGAHVMYLATLLEEGRHTAAGAAALSKELRSAMEAALAGAPRQADEMDELAARRQAKASGA